MTTKNHIDTSATGLGDIDSESHEARDATHFHRIIAARQQIDAAEHELRAAVRNC